MRVYLAVVLAVIVIGGLGFELRAQEATNKDSIRVMSFNVWHGGTRSGQPLSQTAKVIRKAKADVVGLQEIGGNLEKLAELLGWHHYKRGRTGIVSRYEAVKVFDGGIRIRLESGQEVQIFNVHLSHAPYQPYQLLGIPYENAPFLKTEAEAIASAKEAREHQLLHLFKNLDAIPGKQVPTFVTGDFNEPSHLDWTDAAAKAGRHPIKVKYPSSVMMTKAGFADAWRVAHPSEMKKPGYTWTPLTKVEDPKDHHDRIDFVYFKGGGVAVEEAEIAGESKEHADVVVSPYPSDHRAVVATFRLEK